MTSTVQLLPFGIAMNLVFGALLVYQWQARRDPVGGIRTLLREGKVSGAGLVRVNVYHYRRLSVPMICELAELEDFVLVGEESYRESLFLIFQRRGGWGGRPVPQRRGLP